MVFMPHWPISLMRGNVHYSLELILGLLEKLGNPHKKLPPTIHVAGTNGKGSTLAFLESIFHSAGYSFHKYTSPHFLHFNERIIINGQMIEDAYLYELMEKIRYIAEANHITPTLFEASTAAAFLAFSEYDSDILLLETGMGGRLDATNVVENPLLTIITSISYDHMEYLGPTLKLIAGEKAGIIKNNRPCIITDQLEEVQAVLFDVCERKSAPYFAFGYDFSITKTKEGFLYQEPELKLNLPTPSLLGDHQLLNASNAIAAVMRIKDQYTITNENICQGISSTKWRGRLERLTSNILLRSFPNFEFWLDGAHNEGGARMLRIWLKDYCKDREIFMVVGFTKGRDIANLLSHFAWIPKMIFGVRINSEPSSYDVESLEKVAKTMPGINFQTATSITDACLEITKLMDRNTKPIVLFTGSLFLLSDIYSCII